MGTRFPPIPHILSTIRSPDSHRNTVVRTGFGIYILMILSILFIAEKCGKLWLLFTSCIIFSCGDSCFSVCQVLYGIMTTSTPCPLPLRLHVRHSQASVWSQLHPPKEGPASSDPPETRLAFPCVWGEMPPSDLPSSLPWRVLASLYSIELHLPQV